MVNVSPLTGTISGFQLYPVEVEGTDDARVSMGVTDVISGLFLYRYAIKRMINKTAKEDNTIIFITGLGFTTSFLLLIGCLLVVPLFTTGFVLLLLITAVCSSLHLKQVQIPG